MVAARTRLEIATDNVANVSSDGFARTVARGFLTPRGVEVVGEPAGGHGALRHTGRDFDLAIVGAGAFEVRDGAGHVVRTRAGAFTRERDGTLRDAGGRTLIGTDGVLRVPDGARIDERGRVLSGERIVGTIVLPPGSSVHAGYLESSSVDAITEMIDVLSATRSFESAEKVVAAIDGARQKSAGEVARIK